MGYNEEKTIVPSLQKIKAFLEKNKYDYEIIFVNDGSNDNTLSILNKYVQDKNAIKVISYNKNRGKGFAVRQGIINARGTIIAVTDADLAYPIEQLNTFIKEIETCGIAVGTRIHKDSIYFMNYSQFKLIFLRHLVSRIFNLLVRLSFNIKQKDTQCGFKVFRQEVAKAIAKKAKIDGFAYDVEFLVLAKQWGVRVKEIPVTVIHSYIDSKVKILKHAPKMFLEVVRIKLNFL